jgi:alpha-L-fucosidase
LALAAAEGNHEASPTTAPEEGTVFNWRVIEQGWPKTVRPDYQHAPDSAVQAWKDLKFGVRIHWGLYFLIGADASWVLPHSSKEFQDIYGTLYEFFNPTSFDADAWMDLFQRAGAKFFTFTTKHHEGFCLWPTATLQKSIRRASHGFSFFPNHKPNFEECTINYSIMDSPYRRDIVGAITRAARRKGVGVGYYFSHVDWHDPAFAWDPYNIYYDPKFTKQSDPERWQKFIAQEREQLRELLTSYGPIDSLCLDIGWPESAAEDAAELTRMIRKLQPIILIRNRGIGPNGDYYTPERDIPEGFSSRNWMVIYPGGQAFSYLPNEIYKPKEWVLESLIDIVAKGGTFEVGFSPMPNGTWPPEAVQRLEYAGRWLKVNGEAIYATRSMKIFKEGDDIRFTQSKDGIHAYVISLKWPSRQLAVRSIQAAQGSQVSMLGVPELLSWRQEGESMVIDLPAEIAEHKPCEQAFAFKVRVAAA